MNLRKSFGEILPIKILLVFILFFVQGEVIKKFMDFFSNNQSNLSPLRRSKNEEMR
jgi:hypothetical protein